MSDYNKVYAASALIHTGKGHLAGVIVTISTGADIATFYDNTSAAGTKIFECQVSTTQPLVVFFPDRFAPRFATGLYLVLAANMIATVWFRSL